MRNINRAVLLGYLGNDPVIRSAGSADVASFRVATSEQWRDKETGEQKERTDWHTVEVWIPTMVDLVERYLKKGSRVYVEGQIQTRKWTDKDNVERYTTVVSVRSFSGMLVLLDLQPSNKRAENQSKRTSVAEMWEDVNGTDSPF